jgi:hypothetical protein
MSKVLILGKGKVDLSKYTGGTETTPAKEELPMDIITKKELMRALDITPSLVSRDFGTFAQRDCFKRGHVLERIATLWEEGHVAYKHRITERALIRLGYSGEEISGIFKLDIATPKHREPRMHRKKGIPDTVHRKRGPKARAKGVPREKPKAMGAAGRISPDLDAELASIFPEIEDGLQREPENMLEYTQVVTIKDMVDLLGLREKMDSLSGCGLTVNTELGVASYELILSLKREGGLSRYVEKYSRKPPDEIRMELVNYFSCDDWEQLVSFAEEINEYSSIEPSREEREQPISLKEEFRPQAKLAETPGKETAYHSMIRELGERRETMKAREALEEIRGATRLNISYTDISLLANEIYGGVVFLKPDSELPRDFSGKSTEALNRMREEGYNTLESWRARRGIVEYGGILYRKHGEEWMYEGMLSASDTVKQQLNLRYHAFMESGRLPKPSRTR